MILSFAGLPLLLVVSKAARGRFRKCMMFSYCTTCTIEC